MLRWPRFPSQFFTEQQHLTANEELQHRAKQKKSQKLQGKHQPRASIEARQPEDQGVRGRVPGRCRVLKFASLGPPDPLGVPPRPPQPDANDINGRGFGVFIVPD